LVKIFKESGRFSVVDVTEQPGKMDAATFAKYDVIVNNWTPYPDTARQWPAATEKAFLDYLHNGGGFVVFHASSCSFQVWPEFQQIVAMTWKANYTAHGAYHTFRVTIEDKDHPITRDMPDFYTTDELYHNMVQMVDQKLNVVCKAFSAKEERGTGKFEPVLVWTQPGKGRAVNMVLGHDPKAMQTGFRTLLLRSAEWAATGKVTIPLPAYWPTTATMAYAETVDPDAALQAVANYTYGQERKVLYDVEQLVIAAHTRTDPGAAAARNELAAKIAATLASHATLDAKKFLCSQISTLAMEKQVPVLASLLAAQPGTSEAQVADAARGALAVVPGAAADAALLDALAKTSGTVKLGIVESLGDRRTPQAVGALLTLLNDPDPAMAGGAAGALAKIGTPEVEDKLVERLSTAVGDLRLQVAEAYLKCADRRLGAGELVPATAMYARLYAPSEALPIREAALRGLILAHPQEGIPLVREALGGSDVGMLRMALQLVRGLPGNAGTTVITEQLSKAPAPIQVFLLDALAERGDPSALPAVEKAAQSEDLSVRVAALKALGVLGGESQIKYLQGELVQHPAFRWERTDTSIALLNHDRTVWKFNYGKETPKPHFHPVALLDGTVLTCLSPRDHPWHRALWFSWKMLNGLNYWEEDPKTGLPEGRTEVVDANVIPGNDYSARIQLTLTYHPPDAPPLLTEKRTILVSPPDKEGRYRIDWEGTFTAGKQDVLLQGGTAGGGYAGMSVRISQNTKDWRLIDSEGRVDVPGPGTAKNTHGQRARWMDFSLVNTTTGDTGGITILQHPSSLRYPTHWHNIIDGTFPFGYFSPAPLWAEPYTLPAGKTVAVRYRILIHPGRGDKGEIEAEWEAFSR
jgi:type 1 glutamine amidotransferase/HEAT repeat protein